MKIPLDNVKITNIMTALTQSCRRGGEADEVTATKPVPVEARNPRTEGRVGESGAGDA
jgi:hypothetical protein